MKEFKRDIMVKEEVTIKIDEEFLKEAIRVNWESFYFSDNDTLAIAILGDKKLTIDVCGYAIICKNNKMLSLDEIRELIDNGIYIWESDEIELLSDNWFSLNCYIHKDCHKGTKDVWVKISDEVIESEFKNVDEVIHYLTSTFEDEEYMKRFND